MAITGFLKSTRARLHLLLNRLEVGLVPNIQNIQNSNSICVCFVLDLLSILCALNEFEENS